MDIAALKAELQTDPLGRGYAAMSDAAAAMDLNAVYRDRNLDTLTGSEVLNAIDKTELDAKTDAQKRQVWDVLHLGTINPFGMEATMFVDIFGGGSATITSLAAIRKEAASRGVELGLGVLREGHIREARQ